MPAWAFAIKRKTNRHKSACFRKDANGWIGARDEGKSGMGANCLHRTYFGLGRFGFLICLFKPCQFFLALAVSPFHCWQTLGGAGMSSGVVFAFQ